MAVKIERMAAKEVFDPPAYTQTMRVTGAHTIVFISGQVAYDERGQPGHPGDFAAQARATYRALKAQVEAAGGTLSSVVKLTTYLVDIRPRRGYRARPARLADRGRGDSRHLIRKTLRHPMSENRGFEI
jgi:enamine deaminase RidA (YjgF/YER057c/UK114 family)